MNMRQQLREGILARRGIVALIAVLAAAAALAPTAGASSTPTLSLDQSAGKTAGGTANLGMDLKFTNSGTDSARHLTINLPPGLLADASRNGGTCIKMTQTTGTACRVGTGTVTAAPVLLGILNLGLALPVSVNFYLVPPPKPGDLAGLAVFGLGQQLGATGDIKVRPSGDPNGVGVTIQLTLPNQLSIPVPPLGHVSLTQIAVEEINSTFDSLRYPATCPSTPAN